MITLSFLIAALLTIGGPDDSPDVPAAWRYVAPSANDSAQDLALRALPLGAEKPEDVVELVRYRGSRQRYAQLRYGSPASVRVTVVLDEAGPGDADLYVDAERNRRIEPKDRVAGRGRVWRLPLDVAVVDGESTRYERRAVAFRLGATGATLGFGTAGYVTGAVQLKDRRHQARRMDSDGDGLLVDSQDRVWIDLNDDGRWDSSTEQFPHAPILAIAGQRYAVRADPFGSRFELTPLYGTGTARIVFGRLGGTTRGVNAATMLVGRDGSVFRLSGDQAEAIVPVGEYRVGAVSLTLEDPAGGPTWSYVFSDAGRRVAPMWRSVTRDGTMVFDPLGTLRFTTEEADIPARASPGQELTIRPRLYTHHGLPIVTCYRGSPAQTAGADGPGADVRLKTTGGRTLDVARSGFT